MSSNSSGDQAAQGSAKSAASGGACRGAEHDDAAASATPASFQTLHVGQAQSQLLDLYQKVACEKGRIEIVGDRGLCDCVLISKDELDGIERALEMLSSQDHVKAMHDALAQFTGALAGRANAAPPATDALSLEA